jgi:phytoene/squalene synthetase
MSAGSQRQVCWEKIAETDHLFRLTYPYASRSVSERLIAIHALFACLDQLVVKSTDDHVARTKLDWWRRETLKENIKRSGHPVIGYLVESGASAVLYEGALQRLLDATERKLEAKAPADMVEFKQLCAEICQPRIEIESSLATGEGISEEWQQSMAVRGGLILLLRDTFKHQKNQEHALWWVPLGLLARHEMSRAELMQKFGSKSVKALFDELLSFIIFDSNDSGQKALISNGEVNSYMHLLLQGCLHDRQLERMRKSAPSSFGEGLRRLHLRDVFSLWNKARAIRAAEQS